MPTRTSSKTQTTEAPKQAQAVAVLQPSRLPIAPRIGEEYGITSPMWRVLVDQIFPNAKSVEAILMALEYCRHRNLDIFKRPVHIVPMWSSARKDYVETVWPGVSEIRTTAHRTKQYAGMDPMVYGPEITATFEGEMEVWDNGSKKWQLVKREVTYYEWIDVTVYRMVEHVRVPFTMRTFWEESYATIGKSELPNDMWAKRPKGQHMKVAEVAVLRMAFPEELGNEYAAEEMEGKVLLDAGPVTATPRPASGPPTKPVEEAKEEPVEESESEKLLAKLEAALNKAKTIEAIEKAFDKFDVPAKFESDEDREAAFALKTGRLAQLSKGETT